MPRAAQHSSSSASFSGAGSEQESSRETCDCDEPRSLVGGEGLRC